MTALDEYRNLQCEIDRLMLMFNAFGSYLHNEEAGQYGRGVLTDQERDKVKKAMSDLFSVAKALELRAKSREIDLEQGIKAAEWMTEKIKEASE